MYLCDQCLNICISPRLGGELAQRNLELNLLERCLVHFDIFSLSFGFSNCCSCWLLAFFFFGGGGEVVCLRVWS